MILSEENARKSVGICGEASVDRCDHAVLSTCLSLASMQIIHSNVNRLGSSWLQVLIELLVEGLGLGLGMLLACVSRSIQIQLYSE